jgi:2-phosphoglycerate kinase
MSRDQAWAVLLIGGGGAVGKTSVARQIAARYGASAMSADDIRLVLQRVIPADLDARLHYFVSADVRGLDVDEAVRHLQEIGDLVSDALQIVIRHHVGTGQRIVLEGDAITPELAVRDEYAGLPADERVRAVFVEEPDVHWLEQVLSHRARGADTPTAHRLWAEIHHAHGRRLAEAARLLGLAVVAARPQRTLAARIARAAQLKG